MSRPAGFRHSDETRAKMREARLANNHRRLDADRKMSNRGYPEIRDPRSSSGWELEHRVVMEGVLGRELHPGEVVHHIDHDRANNDPSNLMVFASQADHRQFHLAEGV